MSDQSSTKELGSESIVSEVMRRIYEVISRTDGRPRFVHLGHAARDAILDELRARPSMVGSASGNERLRLYAPTGPVEVYGGGADGKISIEFAPRNACSEYDIRFMTFDVSPAECFMCSKN